jgi:hypothetical protein
MYDIEDIAGMFAHGFTDQRTVNAVFGDIFKRYDMNLQLVWDRLVEDVGFDGDAEIFVVNALGDAFHLVEPVRAWIFGETAAAPGVPGTWAGAPAEFLPRDLIGDGRHNLVHQRS